MRFMAVLGGSGAALQHFRASRSYFELCGRLTLKMNSIVCPSAMRLFGSSSRTVTRTIHGSSERVGNFCLLLKIWYAASTAGSLDAPGVGISSRFISVGPQAHV